VIAAINVSGPKFRLGARLAEAGLRARQAAEQLSAILGGSTGAAGRN
jgi:DNA-binding IclR family transcriptional regulator